MLERQFGATLVHIYSQPDRPGSIKLDLRAHMQVIAADFLYKRGLTKKLFIAGGHIYGENKSSAAEIIDRDLIRRGIRRQDIYLDPVATETSAEIRAFEKRAKIENWHDLASVASATHQSRIAYIHHQLGISDIHRIDAELILKGYQDNFGHYHFSKFVKEFRSSISEKLFALREKVVILFYRVLSMETADRLSKSSLIQSIKNLIDR